MSSVTPAPGLTIPTPPVPALPTATLPLPLPALAQLPLGSKIDVQSFVLVKSGVVEIDTVFGKLQLQTGFPLPKDAFIQLQLIGKGNHLQFLILTNTDKSQLDGQRKLPDGGSTSAGGPPGSPATASRSGPVSDAAPVNLLRGTETTAILLRSTSIISSSQVADSSGMKGKSTTPTGKITTGLEQKSGSETPARSNSAVAPTRVTAPGPTPAGARFAIRITSVIPAGQMANGGGIPDVRSASLSNGQVLTGVVVSQNSSRNPIVQTHVGPMSINTPSPVPPGTTIEFLVLKSLINPANTAHHAVIDRTGSVIMETHKWPELDDTLRYLRADHAAIAQQISNAVIPRLDSTLAANILFFINALRGGELRGWLGDAPLRALERQRPDMASRLSDDLHHIARLSDDDSSADWRAVPVPLLNGSQVEQIRLFMRRKKRGGGEDGGEETRFVVDVDLTMIGRFQMDGWILQEKKRFDLIVRTENRLTSKIQNDIRDIFLQANEISGVSGGLTFRAAPPDFVEISTASDQDGGLGLIV